MKIFIYIQILRSVLLNTFNENLMDFHIIQVDKPYV